MQRLVLTVVTPSILLEIWDQESSRPWRAGEERCLREYLIGSNVQFVTYDMLNYDIGPSLGTESPCTSARIKFSYDGVPARSAHKFLGGHKAVL